MADPPWVHAQFDIPAAYLQGRRATDDTREEVFVEQLDGYVDPSKPTFVHPLLGNLYGTKDAGRIWHLAIDPVLTTECMLSKSGYAQCVYSRQEQDKFLFVILYVDDLKITGNMPAWLRLVEAVLHKHFGLKILEGSSSLFLGTEIVAQSGRVALSQRFFDRRGPPQLQSRRHSRGGRLAPGQKL